LERLKNQGTHKTRYWVVFLIAMRVVFIFAVATVSQYKTDPGVLSFVGMCLLVGQLILRILGELAYPIDEETLEAENLDRWVSYAAARIRS
jgi:hypothetical protein